MAIPIEFKQQNIVYAKDQPEYLPLPAYVDWQDHTVPLTTCWKLSWLERLQVLFTGKVWLTVLTFNTGVQPQLISTTNPCEEDKYEQ